MFVQFNSPLSYVRIIYCNKTNVREIRQYGWIIGLLSSFHLTYLRSIQKEKVFSPFAFYFYIFTLFAQIF